MNTRLILIPLALGIAVLLGNQVLIALHMEGQRAWLIPLAAVATYLLFERKPIDLLLVGAGAALSLPQANSIERLGVASDVFLALALGLMMLPGMMSLMGLEYETKVKRTP